MGIGLDGIVDVGVIVGDAVGVFVDVVVGIADGNEVVVTDIEYKFGLHPTKTNIVKT